MKRKIKLLLSTACIFITCAQQVKSQSNVQGIIKDTNDKPVQSANVVLRKFPDSSLVKATISDTSGKYVFVDIKNGQYIVTATFTGMDPVYSKAFEINAGKMNITPEILYLKKGDKQLRNITITYKKTLYEQKIDRLIVNVQSSITSAGSSILEVLQKSPGVVVKRQDNSIAMNGKTGVRVMINDKIMQLPPDVVMQMLDGMNSSNVEKIELITTPPAKYDAEGNAGIIHIVMKGNADLGTNGSYTLTAGYKWAENVGGSFNLNHRGKRYAWFIDYSALRNHNLHVSTMDRRSTDTGFIKTVNDFSRRKNITTQQNINAGFEWNLNTNNLLNIGFSGYRRNWDMNAISTDNNNAARDSTVITNMKIHESNIWQSATAGLGLQTKISTKSNVSFNLDYLYYHNDNPSDYDNQLFYQQHNTNDTSKIDLKKNTPIHFILAKADYQHIFSSTFSAEAGIKAVTSRLTNDVLVQHINDNVRTTDPYFTSYSSLNEQSQAGYISTKWQAPGKWQFNSGLRYEYTHTSISTPAQKNLINRKYGHLFPGAFLKKDLAKGKDFQFSYTRRITRPAYNDIAPFVFFWAPNTFSSGNIALFPAISNTFRAGYHAKQWIVSLQYTHTKNEIAAFQPEKDSLSDNLIYRSQNLTFLNQISLTNSYSFNVRPWWNIQTNITAQYQASRTSGSGKFMQTYGINFSIINTLNLPKGFSAEVSETYQSKTLFGISTFLPVSSLNAGIQKKLGGKGALRLAMDDILYTNFWKIKTVAAQNGFTSYWTYDLHNQYFRLSYTRNFGNNKLQSVKLKSGSEEERGRITN